MRQQELHADFLTNTLNLVLKKSSLAGDRLRMADPVHR